MSHVIHTAGRRARVRAGFTLIELMVSVLIIAILMGIAFRMAGIGNEADNKSKTIARLQRIENCLSGYYAVYGSYPPVPRQGVSPNVFTRVDDYGSQSVVGAMDNAPLKEDEQRNARGQGHFGRIEVACRAQPVAVSFPFSESMTPTIKDWSKLLRELDPGNARASFESVSVNANGRFNSPVEGSGSNKKKREVDEWTQCKLFRYGLLSFLLPRYLFMLGGPEEFYKPGAYAQWENFNTVPRKVEDGTKYKDWPEIWRKLGGNTQSSANRDNRAEIEALPSQSVCRRWLVNLEGILTIAMPDPFVQDPYGVFYGVDTRDKDGLGGGADAGGYWKFLHDSRQGRYLLNEITVLDGWGEPIYYYSEPPYQSYRLWSSGPDKSTFPPWVPLDSLNTADRQVAARWIADDITLMSN